jgi:tetratricopeptide (TPR) repeat protein
MGDGALSIKLRCASWPQLATIYKRDLSHGTMFLRASTPPAIGTTVRIDLSLPSATVIALTGVVQSHVNDPQRGSGVELKLSPIATESVWLIESALASEHKRLNTPVHGVPITGTGGDKPGSSPSINDSADVAEAERELSRALMSEAESLKKLNPFLVLGVGYEATDGEVRAAFGELTKRYHPDRFARYESDELRQVAAEIFILIRDAYRRLGDAASRVQVLQSLGKSAPAPRAVPAPPRALPPVPPVPPPRLHPRAASHAAGLAPTAPISTIPPPDAPGSAPIMPPSATAAPSQAAPRPRAATGPPSASAAPSQAAPRPRAATAPPHGSTTTVPPLAARPAVDPRRASTTGAGAGPRRAPISQPPVIAEPVDVTSLEELLDHGRLDEALAGYKRLAKQHPHDRNVRAGIELCEGLMALAVRDRLEAAQRFEAALEIDPSNERAARELADMRRQATNERKGLLSRLMGKKEP